MSVIWKYALRYPTTGRQTLQLPRGYKILDIQLQDEGPSSGEAVPTPTLWAVVTPGYDLVSAHIDVVFTGNEIPEFGNHISTLQLNGLVCHYFHSPFG